MFFVLSRAWEKEKSSKSPREFEPKTFELSVLMLYFLIELKI